MADRFFKLVAATILSLTPTFAAAGAPFKVTSPVIKPGTKIGMEQVFSGFGCTGGNISPELSWSEAPKDAKSFAVTLYDPDAPTGSGWWHWIIFNIPASVTKLEAGAGDPKSGKAPEGSVQSLTDFGAPGYGGPCPPEGSKPHRYIFTVFALKTDKLDAKQAASGAMVGFMLNANKIATATLEAKFSR
jgi:Raf kinase inhibitor-like YbhB/YbcL family protein